MSIINIAGPDSTSGVTIKKIQNLTTKGTKNTDGVTWNFCEFDIQIHESCFDPCARQVVSTKYCIEVYCDTV